METLKINKEIIKKASLGDLNAFEIIHNIYEKYVLNLAYKIIGNEDSAHDIKQDVFMRIYKSLKTYKESFEFKTWISKITVNASLTYKSNRNKRFNLIEKCKNVLLFKNNIPFEETIADKDFIKNILKRLPENYRAILVLREAEELPYSEIAKILDCSSVDSIKIKLHRARKAFIKEKNYQEQFNQ